MWHPSKVRARANKSAAVPAGTARTRATHPNASTTAAPRHCMSRRVAGRAHIHRHTLCDGYAVGREANSLPNGHSVTLT